MTNTKFTEHSVPGNKPEISMNSVIKPEESTLTDAVLSISSINCGKMACPSINPPALPKESKGSLQEPDSTAKLKNLEEVVNDMHIKVTQTLDRIAPKEESKNLFTWNNFNLKNENTLKSLNDSSTANVKKAKRGRPRKDINASSEIEEKAYDCKKQKKLEQNYSTGVNQSIEERINKLEIAIEHIYKLVENINEKMFANITPFEQKFGKIPRVHISGNKANSENIRTKEDPKILKKLDKEAAIRLLSGDKAYEPTKYKLIELKGIQKCKIGNLKQALTSILNIKSKDLGLISYSPHKNAWHILIKEQEIAKLGNKETVDLKISRMSKEIIHEDIVYLKTLKEYLEDKNIINIPAKIAAKIILNNIESLNEEKLSQVLHFELPETTPKLESATANIKQVAMEESLGVQL
jgi:hypothetical protein